jgi:hypothetical protein
MTQLFGMISRIRSGWGPAEVEAFFARVRADHPGFTMSSGRQYQTTLRMLMDFICDPRYGWLAECQERFGRAPVQILHEWNSVAHVAEFEGRPGRRPLTYDEVQWWGWIWRPSAAAR